MPHHIGCMHPFGRLIVMGTTSGMNMVITTPPPARRRIDPTIEFNFQITRFLTHRKRPPLFEILRPSRHPYLIPPLGELHCFTMGPVNLGMKVEIRSKPLRLGRINPSLVVPDFKCCRSRFAIFIQKLELDLPGRSTLEIYQKIASKSQVLGSLPHVKSQHRRPPPVITRVELNNTIIDTRPGQSRRERAASKDREIKPTILQLCLRRSCERNSLLTCDPQWCSHPCLIDHLDQKNTPAALHQHRFSLASHCFHTRFRIDRHYCQTLRIQNPFHRSAVSLCKSGLFFI